MKRISLKNVRRPRVAALNGELTSLAADAPAAFSATSLQLAGAELGTGQVIGYFAFLAVLILVPFVGGTMDSFRIAEFREKRQDFIDAIQDEIAGLEAEGDPASLEVAQELKVKLGDVYAEIEADKVRDEENKYLGFNRYWMQMRGLTPSDAIAKAAKTGGDRDMVAGEVADGPASTATNREGRRLEKKLKKKRISNANP